MVRNGIGASRGFTLVEALMVIVVVGLLLGIAVPRFAEARMRMQLDTAAYQLAGDLRRAQVEAIKRNQAVTLEMTSDTTYNIDFIGNRRLENGIVFAAGSADSVRMASFGPPLTGAQSFTVEHDGQQKTVSVSAAGLVTVQ
jgi:prepilin-type N-terminal cleavage/methylation domain-containing protein